MEQLTFSFENNQVRTIYVEDKIAFSLSDSLKAIDSNTGVDKAEKTIVEGLGDEWVIKRPIIDNLGREQLMTFVFEAGLTYIISRSRTELGKKFNRWLHTEVLPSIRKTGSYQLKPMTPGELLLQQAQFMLELERKQTQLQEEQIRLAVEQQITKVLAEQANTKVELVDTKVTNLEVEVSALKSILNQPIPTCNQTARQRIVEIAQLTADLLTKKGVYATIQAAIAEVWSRINLKVRNSSLRIDLAARKANNLKRYKTDLRNWESIGKPKGQRPVKKSYALTVPAVIEELNIEQDVLRCAVSVATETIS